MRSTLIWRCFDVVPAGKVHTKISTYTYPCTIQRRCDRRWYDVVLRGSFWPKFRHIYPLYNVDAIDVDMTLFWRYVPAGKILKKFDIYTHYTTSMRLTLIWRCFDVVPAGKVHTKISTYLPTIQRRCDWRWYDVVLTLCACGEGSDPNFDIYTHYVAALVCTVTTHTSVSSSNWGYVII